MAELKTKRNKKDVEAFLNSVENEKKRADAFKILEMMKKITKMKPEMWGPSIVGFGSYHYKYPTGHEGDMCLVGFSPRKQSTTIYIMPGFEKYDEYMSKLGKYTTGKSCLYIKKLEDIDEEVLQKLIKEAFTYMKNTDHDYSDNKDGYWKT